MQGGIPPPPPPNGEACGGMAPIGAGGGMREAEGGARSPGHGAEADGAAADGAEVDGAAADGAAAVARGGSDGHGAGAAVRGGSLGHGSVWAAAWLADSIIAATVRTRR